MIKLITGVPGTGKSAMAVSLLLEYEGKRPIFNMGIPELKIDHVPTPSISEWTELRQSEEDPSILLPYFTFPPDAVIVIDEAQRVYRPRAATSKVPDHVAAFETHRHCGIDFILITQGPSLLDPNIRRLTGQHIHIRDTSLGRFSYEWPECGDVESKSSRSDAIKKRFKLPKRVFSLYKSSDLHTKVRRGIHPGLVLVFICLLLVIFGGAYIYRSISDKGAAVEAAKSDGVGGSDAKPVTAPLPVLGDNPLPDFVPRDPDKPETAQAFDALRQIKNVPRVAACLASVSRCVCYTQQATRLDVTEPNCRRIAKSGEFDYYVDTAVVPALMRQESNKPVSARSERGLPEADNFIGVSSPGSVMSYDKQSGASVGVARADTVAGPVIDQAYGIGRGRVVQ